MLSTKQLVLERIDSDHTAKTNVIQYLTQIPLRRKEGGIDYQSKMSGLSREVSSLRCLISGETSTLLQSPALNQQL